MAATGAAPEHGTEARYRLGCRCARCRKASADARARRKARRDEREGKTPPNPVRPIHRDGSVEQSVREAVASVNELDVWRAPLAQAAIAAAKKIDDGTATPPLYQQLRDLLEAVKGKDDSASGLAGLAAIGGSRGRVGA